MRNSRKARREATITGYGTAHLRNSPSPLAKPDGVMLSGHITSEDDAGRPIIIKLSPDMARHWARVLAACADNVDSGEAKPEAKPEAEPKRPRGRLAELFGMTEGETK
jgi:hypothetical protein